MSKAKQPVDEIWDKVQQEELGYAILHYYGRELNSKDSKLNVMWADAYDKLDAIVSYFNQFDEGLE